MNRSAREQRISITFKHWATDKHWGGIESICLSPFRHALFTGSRDSLIKRWGSGTENGGGLQCEASFEGHCGWVTALSFMQIQPHGLLISASYDTTVKLWNPESQVRSPLHTFQEHSDYVLQLAKAERVGRFVSAGLRGDLNIWDVESCCKIAAAKGSDLRPVVDGGGQAEAGSIYAMHCTPDLLVIAFTGADGFIRLYDPRAHRDIGSLKGHKDNVKAVLVSEDGARVVSGSSDHTIRVWDVRMLACTAALEMHQDSVWALTGDAALSTIISGGRDAEVFITDIATERTELVAKAPAPVLDVQADWNSRTVWVGTTLSEVTAWSFHGLREPSQPVHCHDVKTLSDSGGRPSAQRPVLPAYQPLCTQPVASLKGIAPLVRHAVFEDKRHILTLDSNGVVALWDIVFGKNIRVYEPGVDFEAQYKELFLQMLDPVPAWFTSDVQLGVISLHLTNPQAFTAELYAHALGMRCSDDIKLNYGHEILKSVLNVWRLKCEGRSISDLQESRTQDPFVFLHSRSVRPRITCRPFDSSIPWCQDMLDFTGHEHEHGLLPKWVIEAVTKGQYAVPIFNAKLSFSLVPSTGSGLPKLDRSRLTAPVILEVRKVVHYVRDKLREQNVEVEVRDITFDDNENRETWQQARVPLLQITCKGKLVPFAMTLNTVKRYLFTGRADDDIPLEYSLVDRANPVPLPKIVPKEISNH